MSEDLEVQRDNNRLILDGPSEVINRMVTKFRQDNKEAQIFQEKKALILSQRQEKLDYVGSFISRYTGPLGITRGQFREIISQLKEHEIILLDDVVISRAKKWALVPFLLSGVSAAVCLGSLMLGPQFLPFYLLAYFTGAGSLGLLLSTFDRNYSVGYIRRQKRLKQKYGQNYFPHQELREILSKE